MTRAQWLARPLALSTFAVAFLRNVGCPDVVLGAQMNQSLISFEAVNSIAKPS